MIDLAGSERAANTQVGFIIIIHVGTINSF